MDPQSLELSKASARGAMPYAIGLAAAYFFLSFIPVCGGCINFFLSIGGFVAAGYLLTPKLTARFPAGQSQTMIALFIGLGVAVSITIGFIVANIVFSLIWMALSAAISSLSSSSSIFGSATRGIVGLIVTTFFVTFWGLIAGTGLGFLGSYLAFNRNPTVQSSARPF